MRISDWSSDVCSSDLIRIERLAAVRAAPVGLRIGKEREARDARGDRFLRAIDEEVDRPARYAGQARDRLLGARAVADEERPDEVRRRQMRFAHHRAAPAGAAGGAAEQGSRQGEEEGKGVGERVSHGGRRYNKNKTTCEDSYRQSVT